MLRFVEAINSILSIVRVFIIMVSFFFKGLCIMDRNIAIGEFIR